MKKNFTLFVLLALITLIKSAVINAQTLLQDSLALVDLYNSTDGPHWKNNTNWLTTKPLDAWYGIQSRSRVDSIHLTNNGLKGTIPASIGNITYLEYLYLNDNQLTGGIPSSIDSLKHMQYCYLSNNKLTGSIPVIKDLNSLAKISLAYNQLKGNIPSVNTLTKLQTLCLNNNQLTGTIPAWNKILGFNEICLNKNNLTGSIPEFAYSYYYLVQFRLDSNELTGNLPASIRYVSSQIFNFSYNQLSGAIPAFSGYSEYINLSHNQFTGNVPDSLFMSSNLQVLNLQNNKLTGNIPAAIGDAYNLTLINLSYNQISGTIPTSIKNCLSLNTLVLNNNKLTGALPGQLGGFNNGALRNVYLNNNKLTGTIPDSLGIYGRLNDLDLSYNQLSGSIASGLGKLTVLTHLKLNDNKLTGSIPASFNNFLNIDTLMLQHNYLSGAIPSLQNLARIGKLSLRLNAFTFSGLEAIQQQFGNKALYYDQAVIPLHLYTNTLSLTAGGTLSNNTYTWYKDGTVYATHTGDSTLAITLNGSYYVSVANSVATGLILYSDTITVSGFNKPATSITVYPNPATSNATALFNATGSYTLVLSDASGNVLQTIQGISNKVQNKVDFNISNYLQGMYFISIKDEKETRLLKLTKE